MTFWDENNNYLHFINEEGKWGTNELRNLLNDTHNSYVKAPGSEYNW